MLFFYNLAIRFYTGMIWVFSFFNHKAKLWYAGRINLLPAIASQLKYYAGERSFWFHFASLGEFEQGRSLLEKIRQIRPDKKLIVTFFSPSGYEVRKNYAFADHVFYLPSDTADHARKFISLVNPEIAVFTKYDYWYHYFNELQRRDVPLFVISAIFSRDKIFFKWYGALHRRMLKKATHIFVQDIASKDLLQTIGITAVSVAGDTRFDRVAENAQHAKAIPLIEQFIGSQKVFIAGSTWPTDEKLVANISSELPDWKFIIAPHEIAESRISDISVLFPERGTIRYSEFEKSALDESSDSSCQVMIVDNIGMLSSIYRYADLVFIGGGFGAGIHNTLEAAAFGVPVIFGPRYKAFREAVQLITCGGAFSIADLSELKEVIIFLKDQQNRSIAGSAAAHYVSNNVGATPLILNALLEIK